MSFVLERGPLRYPVFAVCACIAWLGLACGPSGAPVPPAAEAAAEFPPEPADARPVVLFLGTSLTAGYGLASDDAFPGLVEERIAAQGLDYRVVNAGVSGDTSAGGLRRLDWLLRLPLAVLVLELGANDMLRGQNVDALRENLAAILTRTRAEHPDVKFVVAGMRAAPNLGAAYAGRFESVYAELAERFGAVFVPFLLEGVAGDPELNQPDGIHPTADGHQKVADTLWPALEPLLD